MSHAQCVATDLGEITLDPVPVGLFFGQSSPVLVLELLLSENKNDSSGSDHLFCLLQLSARSSLGWRVADLWNDLLV